MTVFVVCTQNGNSAPANAVAVGAAGTVLTSNGATVAPSFSAGVAVGGTNGQVQVNNNGALAGIAEGTAGQVLTSAGPGAPPTFAAAGGGSDSYVSKPLGTARASTTVLANDPDLLFAAVAAGRYSFDGVLFVTNAGGTANFKCGFLASGAPTNSVIMLSAPGIAAQGQNNWLTVPIAGNFAIPAASIGIAMSGEIVLSAPTDLTLQWAQQVSDPANTTLNAGSYLHIHKIA